MVSRKKAKGKARRAAKDAKVEGEEAQEGRQEQNALGAQMQRLTINNLLSGNSAVRKCRHGFEVESHEEKLYQKFMTMFEDVCYENLKYRVK